MADASNEEASNNKKNTPAAQRREQFARRYVIHKNAARAYREVYGAEGATAEVNGSRMLSNAKVAARVAELEAESLKRLEITKDKVEREIAAMAFIDIRGFYNENGTLKPPQEWTEQQAAAVASMEVEELYEGSGKDRTWIGYVKKIKLWSRLEANALLGAKHGIGVKKLEVGGPGDFETKDAEALRKRVSERAARLGMVVKFPKKAA